MDLFFKDANENMEIFPFVSFVLREPSYTCVKKIIIDRTQLHFYRSGCIIHFLIKYGVTNSLQTPTIPLEGINYAVIGANAKITSCSENYLTIVALNGITLQNVIDPLRFYEF